MNNKNNNYKNNSKYSWESIFIKSDKIIPIRVKLMIKDRETREDKEIEIDSVLVPVDNKFYRFTAKSRKTEKKDGTSFKNDMHMISVINDDEFKYDEYSSDGKLISAKSLSGKKIIDIYIKEQQSKR